MKGEEVSDVLYALSCEPDLRVRIFSGYLVDGIRFHTTDRDKSRRTQNNGVMAEGTHDGDPIDFYGSLKEIIELQYNSDLQWISSDVIGLILMPKSSRMKDDGFFRSINRANCWYKDDPFILATQATKIFYLKDTAQNAES